MIYFSLRKFQVSGHNPILPLGHGVSKSSFLLFSEMCLAHFIAIIVLGFLTILSKQPVSFFYFSRIFSHSSFGRSKKKAGSGFLRCLQNWPLPGRFLPCSRGNPCRADEGLAPGSLVMLPERVLAVALGRNTPILIQHPD